MRKSKSQRSKRHSKKAARHTKKAVTKRQRSKHFSRRRRAMRGGVRADLPTVGSANGIPMPAGFEEARVDFPGGAMTLKEYREALEKGWNPKMD